MSFLKWLQRKTSHLLVFKTCCAGCCKLCWFLRRSLYLSAQHGWRQLWEVWTRFLWQRSRWNFRWLQALPLSQPGSLHTAGGRGSDNHLFGVPQGLQRSVVYNIKIIFKIFKQILIWLFTKIIKLTLILVPKNKINTTF